MSDEENVESGYFLAEGVAAEGDKPDWYMADKYKSVADQAAAYPEAQKRIGELSEKLRSEKGPDDYVLNAPEGFEVDQEDPLLEKAVEYAKSINLSQAGYDDLISLYAQSKMAEQQGLEDFYKAEVAKIENYDAREKDIADFLEANELSSLAGMITTAEQMSEFEKLLGMAGKATLDPESIGDAVPTMEEIQKLQFEKDEHGRRIMSYDKERQKQVRKMLQLRVGKGDHHQMVG